VFEATHGLILDLAAAGLVDGLRIDHPDGLRDPERYFERLQAGYSKRAGIADDSSRPLYVVAEKIAARPRAAARPVGGARHHRLPLRFAGERRFRRPGRAQPPSTGSGARSPASATISTKRRIQGKRSVLRGALASELNVLARRLLRIARSDRRTRDYTFNTLRRALAEIAACFPCIAPISSR
jgi:(1->4)-alpha-D-glucan 1-alpha-D-glucosylmutase